MTLADDGVAILELEGLVDLLSSLVLELDLALIWADVLAILLVQPIMLLERSLHLDWVAPRSKFLLASAEKNQVVLMRVGEEHCEAHDEGLPLVVDLGKTNTLLGWRSLLPVRGLDIWV